MEVEVRSREFLNDFKSLMKMNRLLPLQQPGLIISASVDSSDMLNQSTINALSNSASQIDGLNNTSLSSR